MCVALPCFVEKDTNNEVLWAWSFPGVDGAMRNLLMKKCNLDKQAEEDSSEVLPYMFGHFLHVWYYFMNFKVDEGNPKFPKVGLLKSNTSSLCGSTWAIFLLTSFSPCPFNACNFSCNIGPYNGLDSV